MKKMTTFFLKDPKDLGRVINEVNPDNMWAFNAIATRKFDGTACAIIGGDLYKRYDAKKGREIPHNAIACQEPDKITGHHPHWVKCSRTHRSNQYHFQAFDAIENKEDGTYELYGEKVQSNPEKIKGHKLIRHGIEVLDIPEYSFKSFKDYLTKHDIEGIVFHLDGKMCKIRKGDFGIKR